MRELMIAMVLGVLLSLPAGAAQAVGCGAIDGVDPLLSAPGVFVGDIHGSEQSPAFLRDLSCHVVHVARPLVIALEYDGRDQAILDRFLSTPDEDRAKELLTSTPHWKGNQDGRASSAMRDAMLSIWRLARTGARVELLAYDGKTQVIADRDKASAEFIREKHARKSRDTFWIVFGGNVHARKTKGLNAIGAPPGYKNYEPLGYLIRDWGLIHLNAMYHGGSSWGCTGQNLCGVRVDGPACTVDCPPHPRIRLGSADPAYDGVYEVGRLTPSPPLYWKR